MSTAKLNVVKSARKDQGKCSKCEKKIPKGSPYVWWTVGFRSRYKHKRCGACPRPKASERESNSSVAILLSANEAFEDALAAATSIEDVKTAVSDAAEGVRDALSDWEEKKSNLEQAFQNGSPAIEEIEEHMSNAEALAEALDQFDVDEPAEGEEVDETKLDEARDEARDCWDGNYNW